MFSLLLTHIYDTDDIVHVFADHIEDPKGGFTSGSMSGWKVFIIIIIAIIGLAVCGVVGYVVFNKDGGYNSKRFY